MGTVLCSQVQMVQGVGGLRGEVIAREEVDVDFDERPAFKLAISDGTEDRDFSVHAWISDDAERLPMRLMVQIDKGTFDLELDEVDR